MIIKDHGRRVGVASRVGKAYVLDMLVERAIPAEAVTDHQEGVTDGRGPGPDSQTSEYTRWHQRFGHLSPQLIRKVYTVVGGLLRLIKPAKD